MDREVVDTVMLAVERSAIDRSAVDRTGVD